MTQGRPTSGGGTEPAGETAPAGGGGGAGGPGERGTGDGARGAGSPGWKAGLAAVLLLVTGAALGITVDRLWLRGPAGAGGAPLTVDGMARSLDLGPEERTRVRRLLDSLEVEVAEAVRAGPDSLRTVARRARARLEGVLPPHARPEFRRWMQSHHRRMMERMHGPGGGPIGPGGPGRMRMHADSTGRMHRGGGGMMQSDTPPRRR